MPWRQSNRKVVTDIQVTILKVKTGDDNVRKNRVKLILCSLLVLIVIVIILLKLSEVKLLTGDRTKMVKATITLAPSENPKIIIVEDKETLNKIYDLVYETYDIRVVRYPSHSQSIQSDSRFDLEILYSDGKVDLIHTPEVSNRIYRHFNSKNSTRERGFIAGRNDNLESYLNNLGESNNS